MIPHIECIEDMTFSEAQADGTTLRVIVTNVDLGKVSVRYERDIVSHGGSHGVIYDVEDAGMDVFDEETVDGMVADGTWVIVTRPVVFPDGDDS